jgi:hypothetical protein
MSSSGEYSARGDKRRHTGSSTPPENLDVNSRRKKKVRRRTKMAAKPVNNDGDSVQETIDGVAKSQAEAETSGSDDSFPLIEPPWLTKVLSRHNKNVETTFKREMKQHATTMTASMAKGLKSLRTELTGEIKVVASDVAHESSRIDVTNDNLDAVRRKSVLTERDFRTHTKKSAEETKAVNDRVSKLGKDLQSHVKRLDDQLASSSTTTTRATPVDRTNLPVVCAITIDGIPEGESNGDELLNRCQHYCFRHMGYAYTTIQVAECFRVGREQTSTVTSANPSTESVPRGRPRSVYCLFNDICYRDSVLRRRFELRGHRIYVNEYHPWEVEQDRIRQYPILRKARSMRKYRNKVTHVANKIIIDNTAYGVEDFSKLPKDLDPRYIATETRGDITYFFKCDSPLSNHHLCDFNWEARSYNCSEQAYFVAKAAACKDTEALRDIMAELNPKMQKRLGESIVSTDEWENEKVSIMEDIVGHKFAQNPHLMSFLSDTKSTYLCEDSPSDSFWGIGVNRNHPDSKKAKDHTGNNMGKILMRIRDQHHASTDSTK